MKTFLALCLFLFSSTSFRCMGQSLEDAEADADESVTKIVTNSNWDDGRKVRVTKLSDRNCTTTFTKTDFEDKTSSDIIDDLEKEQGLIKLSKHVNRCYVRDIKGAKQECEQKSRKGDTESTTETTYELGPEQNVTDLPEEMRPMCQNATIIKLIPVSEDDLLTKDGNDAPSRVRRQLPKDWYKDCYEYEYNPRVKCKKQSNCKSCGCVGWFLRKRTCEKCCDESESCDEDPYYRCTKWNNVEVHEVSYNKKVSAPVRRKSSSSSRRVSTSTRQSSVSVRGGSRRGSSVRSRHRN